MSTMLPKYPALQRAGPAESLSGHREVLSPRASRILFDLAWLILIVVILYELRPTTPAIEHPRPCSPLDFAVIKARYDRVHWGMTGGEVEALLGPPTEHDVSDPELEDVEKKLWNFGRNPMPEPSEMFWDRWSDPANKGRWVAVLYQGYSKSAIVYATIKRGF